MVPYFGRTLFILKLRVIDGEIVASPTSDSPLSPTTDESGARDNIAVKEVLILER
jgi:hypothetical protein